jgi:hypothetical protein
MRANLTERHSPKEYRNTYIRYIDNNSKRLTTAANRMQGSQDIDKSVFDDKLKEAV